MRRKEGGSNGSGGLPVPGRQGPNPGCWNQNREATLLIYLRNNHSRDPEQLLNYTNHSSVKIQPCQFVICSETLKARDTEHQHFKCNLITCTRYYTYLVTRLFFFFFLPFLNVIYQNVTCSSAKLHFITIMLHFTVCLCNCNLQQTVKFSAQT